MIDEEVYKTLKSFEKKKVKIEYRTRLNDTDFVVGTVLWINPDTLYLTTNGLDSAVDIHLNDIIGIQVTK